MLSSFTFVSFLLSTARSRLVREIFGLALAADGSYRGRAPDARIATDANSPKNPYSIYLRIVFDGTYGLNNGGTPRHNLKTGGQIPVNVLIELDRKVDDGKPYKGALQFSTYQGNGSVSPTECGPAACTTALDPDAEWNLQSGNMNCGAVTLF